MAEIINVLDLPASVRSSVDSADLDLMVAGANAKATRVAPCLGWDGSDAATPLPTADQLAEARLVLVGAVKRWTEAGSGAAVQQTAGPFSQTVDNRQRTGYNLWPSEIEQLQAVCKTADGASRRAFSVDTAPTCSAHLPWCSLELGATYCSCGVDIAGYPIYELG